MESKLRSKKRKQESNNNSNPFMGIFTRSKSQIYLHNNRSGRARSDTIRKHLILLRSSQPPPSPTTTKPKRRALNEHQVSSSNNNIQNTTSHNISIKDLRARRVFSPPSINGDSGEIKNAEAQKFPFGCGVCDVEEQRDDDYRLEESLSKESILEMTTTPDSSEQKPHDNNGNGKILNASVCRITDKQRNKDSVTRVRKVFKTPSSFSYRRLLPFLMDIAKDDPCVKKIGLGVSFQDQSSNGKKPKLSSIMSNFCSPKDEDGIAFCNSEKSPDNQEIKSFNTDLSLKDQDLNQPNLSETEGNTDLHNVDQSSTEDGDLLNGVDKIIEEQVQTTPPDIDIFSKPKLIHNMGNTKVIDLQTNDPFLGRPLKGSASKNDTLAFESNYEVVNKKNDLTSKSKLILNPCSRLKVYKTPSSFSYRRLLPYLMDVRNDGSCNSFDAPNFTHCPKVENVSEEKSHLPVSASLSQEISTETSKIDYSPTQDQTGDSELNPPAILLASFISKNELTLTSAKSIIESQMPLDSPKERFSQTEQVMSNKSRSMEPATCDESSDLKTTSPAMPLWSPANHESLYRDAAVESFHCASIASQEDHTVLQREYSKDAKSIKAVSFDQNLSHLEAFSPEGISVYGLTKGILRRNPRGCRGLCNCLNCASFRLHADRAFEFSRNQMQDAEEMALELIKELSYLRNMLEKSTVDANDPAVVHVNQLQVKEACTKAFKAEELAKCRLSEMNNNLGIHCRSMVLQRPRVSFANYVEEIVIPKTDLQADRQKE